MATTLQEIASFLQANDLKFRERDETTIVTGFSGLDHYRDTDGDPAIGIVIRLEEDGRYLKIFAPNAYKIPVEDAGPVLQACSMVQWRTKLVQFEYDESDGELRPIVEFPLEDSALTERQLMRCVHGLVQLVDHYHGVLVRARDEGEIEFEDGKDSVESLSRLLSGYSPETLAEALKRADMHRRRN